MKKLLSVFLSAVCFLGSLAAPACAEEGFANFNKQHTYTAGQFPDVEAGIWYEEDVAAVFELGLMKGRTDGYFSPGGSVTLAETVALAARVHAVYHGGSAEFKQGKPWYQVYVDYAVKNEILDSGEKSFDAAATRSDFAAILARALPESALPAVNEIDGDQLPDVKTGDRNAEAIYRLYRAGILRGNDDYGSFAPESGIRRGEVAAILGRMVYRSLRQRFTLKVQPVYPDLAARSAAEDAFFADAAMLGNSLVDGMQLCSGISMSYYGGTGLNVFNNRSDELIKKQFGKVYIGFGINEIGYETSKVIESYGKIIDKIRAAMPEAEIYVMALTPVTKARSDEGTFTMKKITALNEALYAMAKEKSCWYLDCCTPLCGADGYLPAAFGGWDGSPHLSGEGYLAWADVLRTYYADETITGENK